MNRETVIRVIKEVCRTTPDSLTTDEVEKIIRERFPDASCVQVKIEQFGPPVRRLLNVLLSSGNMGYFFIVRY